MTDDDSTQVPAEPAATSAPTTPPKPKRNTGLIVTIVVLVLIILAGAIAAAFGAFSPAEEPEAEPTATPEETVEPEPEPEPEPIFAGWANPQTWCTAVRHTSAPDFAESPSFIWWATVLSTEEGELAVEGTQFELVVPGADAEPVEATVGEFGILEVIVPISAYGIYEIFEMNEAGDGPIVAPPFVGVEVTEEPFGPECEGPEEPALDDLILESELLG